MSTAQPTPNVWKRFGLLVAIACICFSAIVAVVLWSQHNFRNKCRDVAAKLTDAFRSDPRFRSVRVGITTRPEVTVDAPDELPAATKADLEAIISKIGGSLRIRVLYLQELQPAEPR